MNRRLKIGAVSYLNTMPLLYGIERSPVRNDIDLITDYPSSVASQLLEGKIDIGLVPVAIIPELPYAEIIGDYCIGADKAVASVCIFSQVPMEQIETVVLDYQSRTSIALAQVLLQKHWKKSVVFKAAKPGFENEIQGTTAAVVIGDRALQLLSTMPYAYDLAEAWQAFTGLPFVFAAWVANKPIPASFVQAFNEANALGLAHIDEVVKMNADYPYDLQEYFRQNISYHLTAEMKTGLELFLNYLKAEWQAPAFSNASNF
ncbi:MAG TPA: menaquinone biosynthesis protein [Phnomibacter sp.]|nr:menaquinone biosynthesis protein [Phnomibacter sp.]